MKESVHLRTFEKGDFRVFEMLENDDELIIALPHRVSLYLNRMGSKINLDCDLGMISSSVDFLPIGQIDIAQPEYQSAVVFNEEFLKRARSFENHFHIEKFIRCRREFLQAGRNLPPGHVFGPKWQDQVYIHLAKPTWDRIANLEFSVIRADYMDDERLSEPMFTLCGSLELKGKIPHYFFFIDWFGNDLWVYEKHFFYNNTVFPPTLESFKQVQAVVV